MKKLLTILFPVILIIACSIGVWANEQSATRPCCDKGAMVVEKTGLCEKCARDGKAAEGCDKCAKPMVTEGQPCGGKGCDKYVKMQPAENKPCCDKGSDKFVQLQAAEGKPCGTKGGCDKCAKMQQTEQTAPAGQQPCCNKVKQQ